MNGKKLKKLRENEGLLQKQLGKKLGISASTIGMYEQERREPDNNNLKKIANYFNVSTDYLLDNAPSKSEEEEIEILKQLLIKNGYMGKDEDLSKKQLEKLIEFVKTNKKFIEEEKNE